jgi:hypothetical protein
MTQAGAFQSPAFLFKPLSPFKPNNTKGDIINIENQDRHPKEWRIFMC